MKYLVRSVKYFFYLLLVLALVIFILVKCRLVESDIELMFRNGYDSLWQIAVIVAAFAAIYPKYGFCTREAVVPASFQDSRDGVVGFMNSRRYLLEKESEETLLFRHSSTFTRIFRMFEDRVTVSKTLAGYALEGPTKDIVRLAAGLEFKFNLPEEDENR